ncbi:hypothetical protein ABT084_27430 [Streptomyces sp. NPDC002138]|uniref:hypothetical protein n=1 Tax=Streptomyces sp. NPDC002138 TaxID=3154410 RepID=UPI00331C473F
MMLYVCVEGVSPMRRSTTLATLAAVLEEPVPVPLRAGPLAAVLAELLVRDPAERPAAEGRDGLLAAVAPDAGTAVPPEPTRVDRAPTSPAGASPVSGRPPSAARFGPPPRPLPPPPPSTPVPSPPHAATPRDALPTIGPLSGREPHEPGPARRRKATALAAVAAVTALALIGIGRYTLFRPGGGGHGDGRGAAAPKVSVVSTVPGSPSATPPPGPAPAPGSSAGTAGSPGATDTPAGTRPRVPAAIVPGGDDPAPGAGRWIAQLYSEPESTGIAARDQRLAAVHAVVPEAGVLRSEDYASLRPGYWVIYAPARSPTAGRPSPSARRGAVPPPTSASAAASVTTRAMTGTSARRPRTPPAVAAAIHDPPAVPLP